MHHRNILVCLCLSLLALFGLGGCAEEEDSFWIEGRLTAQAFELDPEIRATVFWNPLPADYLHWFDYSHGDVPVSKSGSFAMEMWNVPPEKVPHSSLEGEVLVEHHKLAGTGPVPGGTVAIGVPEASVPDELGSRWVAKDRALLYVGEDVKPSSYAELIVGGTPKRGYYVVDIHRKAASEREEILACQLASKIPVPGLDDPPEEGEAYRRAVADECGLALDTVSVSFEDRDEPFTLTREGAAPVFWRPDLADNL